jgi:hypothetical protein
MTRRASAVLCAAAALCSTQTFAQEKARPALTLPQQKAPPALPANEEAIVQQFERNWAPQLQLVYKTELHFMRVVCQPTKQQFQKIAEDSEPSLKAILRTHARAARWAGAGALPEPPEPRTAVSANIIQSVRTTLTTEQAAAYEKELDHRAAAAKQAVLSNLVDRIDRLLFLSPEQRDKLGKMLADNWKDSWNQTQIIMYRADYFPKMPDDEIVPILTDTQKVIWGGVRKGIRIGFSFNMLRNVQFDDEVWEEDRTPEKRGNTSGKGNEAAAPVKNK